MGKDFFYRLDPRQISNAERYRATRMAVLTPLYARKWLWGVNDGAAEFFGKLRVHWYRRLDALADAGWGPPQDAGTLHFMRNCPPCGVGVRYPCLPCGAAHVCPFCYARRVVLNAFRHFEKHLYGDNPSEKVGGNWKEMDPSLRLIEFGHTQRTYPLSREAAEGWGPELVRASALPVVLRLIRKVRTREVDMLDLHCGAVNFTVWPEDGRLALHRGGLLVTAADPPAGFRAPEFTARKFKFRVHRSVTRGQLAVIMARTFAYPRAMMTGPADLVKEVLDGLHRVRLLSKYGKRRARGR